MIRLVWLVLGFVGGVATAQNSRPMSNPSRAAVVLMFVVACGICWWAAYRGKSSAVATAVAVADARAEAAALAAAEADARAAALASVVVNVAHGTQAPQASSARVDGNDDAASTLTPESFLGTLRPQVDVTASDVDLRAGEIGVVREA